MGADKPRRPYVSLDIETTGLDDRSHILEIGAVYEDWVTPITELKRVRIPIDWNHYSYAEPYALFINAKLIEQIAKREIRAFSPGAAASEFIHFIEKCHKELTVWDTANGLNKSLKGKIQFAGKNVSGFDLPKIELFLNSVSPSTPSTPLNHAVPGHFMHKYNACKMHRCIDTGSVYLNEFGYIPNLTEINKLNDRNEVAHTAIEDAIDVIVANRSAAGYKS